MEDCNYHYIFPNVEATTVLKKGTDELQTTLEENHTVSELQKVIIGMMSNNRRDINPNP